MALLVLQKWWAKVQYLATGQYGTQISKLMGLTDAEMNRKSLWILLWQVQNLSFNIEMDNSKKSLKDKGNEYYRKGEYSLASAMYRQHVAHPHPDNKNAYSNWSICAYKLEDYSECLAICRQALKLDPAYTKVHYRMAEAYQKQGDFYGAMISATKFCENFEGERQEPEYIQMKGLLESSKKQLYPVVDQISSKDSLLFPENSKAQEGSSSLSSQLSILGQEVTQLSLHENINALYGQINQQNKKQVQQSHLKQIRTRQGKLHPPEQVAPETELPSQHLHQQQASETVPQPLPHSQKSEQAQSIAAPCQQQNYEKYFMGPLLGKNDLFQGFYEVLTGLLSSDLDRKELGTILHQIPTKYDMFGPLQMSLSAKQKEQLKTKIERAGLDSPGPLIKVYCY